MLLITKPQQYRFFREWSQIVSANGWPHDQAETERKALLRRAGFNSLTEVDPVAGYTAVLKELAALQDNLSGMLYADENPRRLLIHNCRKLADEAYIVGLAASDRFKSDDWTALPTEILNQLRNTLADRMVQQHRPVTKAQRSYVNRQRRASAPDPEARIKFPESEFVAGPF